MKQQIIEALGLLDPTNDDQWTADGLPKVEALKLEGIRRADITDAAPHYRRDNRVIEPAVKKDEQPVKLAEPKPVSLDEQREVLLREVESAAKAAQAAKVVYDRLLVQLDEVERARAVRDGNRSEQQTIMDYLEAQRQRREARSA